MNQDAKGVAQFVRFVARPADKGCCKKARSERIMKTTSEFCRFVRRPWCVTAVGLALMVGTKVEGGDLHLDVLQTRTGSFTNVTVLSRSNTDIFIRHARGIGNVKLENLDPETLGWLNSGGSSGDAPAPGKSMTAPEEATAPSAAASATPSLSTSNLSAQLSQKMAAGLATLKRFSAVRPSPNVLALVLGGLVAGYLFLCHCLKLICMKTGFAAGVLIWIPFLQLVPLLRAAGMSGWWLVGFLIPGVNLIAQIVWCFKIVQKRGKSALVAIALLLPVTNLLAILYLAFSSGAGDEDRPVSITTLPSALVEA